MRAVYDAVVFVQAMISGTGPSAECVKRALNGQISLFVSDAILDEVREVPLRLDLTKRYRHLTAARVGAFVRQIEGASIHIPRPPRAFELPRDPQDEPYTDLAIMAEVAYLVTWNRRHLNYLMNEDTPEGLAFCAQFPNLKILTPPALLAEIASKTI